MTSIPSQVDIGSRIQYTLLNHKMTAQQQVPRTSKPIRLVDKSKEKRTRQKRKKPGKQGPMQVLSPRPEKPDTPTVGNDASRTSSKRIKVISDKWWLLAFLIHTAAYLGASGWINYAAIANDKMAITNGTLGPIDT
jgi:hypothetical protein